MQFVLDEYKDRLQIYYNEACAATSKTGSKKPALSMDAWCDICKGELRIGSDKKQSAKAKALWKKVKVTYYKGGSEEAKEFALVGDYQVHRESQITGDDRCKEVFKCRLTLLEVKFAFLNSQGMEQMKAGDATDDDAMACLDFEEFLECLCRCGRDKFVECGMPLHEAIRGFILNLLGLKMEEGVMRDYFYISADRFDWREAKPLEGQKLTAHRKWLDCWQNLALSDLHYFPTWEKEVHDVLQETFPDLTAIFSFYSKSIGGSTTAEDAVEMTMTEFKDLVKDVNLETKDLRFEQMQVLFMKANALNSEEAHAQRAAEKLDKESKLENARAGGNKLEGKKAPARRASASAAREDEKDQELVLYEFIALLVRISFWRANPYHGIHKLATTLIPFPECLRSMLHEVVLPLAQRDDSALFKDKLAEDEDMQAALTEYKERLKVWFNKETQSMHLCGEKRKIKYEQ